MDTKTLLALIKSGETSKVELKLAPPRPSELAQRLCGFANAGGGYVILGVVDEDLTIVGLANPKDAIDTILQATRLCKPTILLDPIDPETYVVGGKTLVLATVPPNKEVLYQASGVFWVRRGSHTIPLEVGEIEQYLYSRGISSWEKKPVIEATLDDLEMSLVSELIATRPERLRTGGRLDNLEEFLINLKCAVKLEQKSTGRSKSTFQIHPTNAGLILFGKYPQRFIIQGEVTCILYGENLGVQRFIDRRVISGTIRDLIDGVDDFFRKHISVGGYMEGFHRIDQPEYPLEVLREAVVNAVVHRDYSLEGESVRVFYYPDRIEIRNPGLLLPGLTVEDLEQGRAISKLRNPILAGILRDLPGGYMERVGSGVNFMVEQLLRLGYRRPNFKQQGEFVVTFYHKTASQETQPEKETFNWGEQETRLIKLMEYLNKNGSITNREYRNLTGISEATGLRDFEQLLERGVLKVVGKGRTRHYTLP